MAKKTFQRKKILVQRKIQFRFARFVLLFVLLSAFIASSIVFFGTLMLLGDKLAGVYPQGRLAPVIRSAYLIFGASMIVILPPIFFMAIRFSHLTVGPLPKIYRYLMRIGQGEDPGELVIREKDQLQELAQVINGMAQNLRQRHAIKPPSTEKSD